MMLRAVPRTLFANGCQWAVLFTGPHTGQAVMPQLSAQAPPLTPHLEPVKHLGEKPTRSCLCSGTTEISTVYRDVTKPVLFSEATFPRQHSVRQQRGMYRSPQTELYPTTELHRVRQHSQSCIYILYTTVYKPWEPEAHSSTMEVAVPVLPADPRSSPHEAAARDATCKGNATEQTTHCSASKEFQAAKFPRFGIAKAVTGCIKASDEPLLRHRASTNSSYFCN